MSASNESTFRHDSFKKSTNHSRRSFLRRALGAVAVAAAAAGAAAGAVVYEDRHSPTSTTTEPPTTTTSSDRPTRRRGRDSATRCTAPSSCRRTPATRLTACSTTRSSSTSIRGPSPTAPRLTTCAVPRLHGVPRRATRGALGWSQLRRLLEQRRAGDRRQSNERDHRRHGGQHGARRRRREVDRRLQRRRQRRAAPPGRLVPDGRHRRTRPRRGYRRVRTKVRTDDRQHPAATIVTADARVLDVDASTNADLWWASRGGGGGNFGVVTSFEFDVHPMPEVTLFTLQYPWSAASTMLECVGPVDRRGAGRTLVELPTALPGDLRVPAHRSPACSVDRRVNSRACSRRCAR